MLLSFIYEPGLVTGGTGGVFNARGLIFAASGVATITLDATTGDATFAGTLSAPNGTLGTITAGTITGATIQTATTGDRTTLDSNNLRFYNGATQEGLIKPDATKNMVIGSVGSVFFTDLAGNPNAELTSNSNLKFSNDAYISWSSGRKITAGAAGLNVDGFFGIDNTGHTATYSCNGSEGKTGDLKDSTSTKIATVVGGIITQFNY